MTVPRSPRMRSWQWLLCTAVFVTVGLMVGSRSLSYGWNWDDLHLIRTYSRPEIAGSFRGTWDPDGVETKGLRPITVLFNDARSRLFGEWTIGHRIFLIVLFSVYLAGLASLMTRLGAPWWAGIVAGIITLTAKYSFYHFVWISDGIHLVPAVLFVASAHLLLRFLDTGRTMLALASATALLFALAAREDALALYLAVPLIGAAYAWLHGGSSSDTNRLFRYGGLLFATFIPFWTWRLLVVPRAPNFRVNAGVILQPLQMIWWTPALAGQTAARAAFVAVFIALLAAAALLLARSHRVHAALWLLLAAVACVPGAVIARPNLLLFPVSFYAAFAAVVYSSLAMRSRRWAIGGAAALLVAVTVSAQQSRLAQLSLHPMSSERIANDWFSLYSKARFASIPPGRLARTRASLAALGMSDERFDTAAWQQQLRDADRIGFVDDGRPFVPAQRFLSP